MLSVRRGYIALLAGIAVIPACAQMPAPTADLINKCCAACHSERTRAGALVLEKLDLESLPEHAAGWER
jgi:hypothetical protein